MGSEVSLPKIFNSNNPVAQGNTFFAGGLYKVLSTTEDNVFFSPFSVHVILSMVHQGADGTTAESLAKVLHVPNEPRTIAKNYRSILTRLDNIKKVTLLMANKLYLQEDIKLLDTFNTNLSKYFLTEVGKVDFAKNTKAATTVNNWISKKTRNKIQNAIDPANLGEDTRLILVNAIYFKGNWKIKFDKRKTKTEPFFLNNNEKVDVQMMHISRENTFFNFKYDENLDAQIIELPYTDKNVRMIIILPEERGQFDEFKEKLATFNWANITDGMKKREAFVLLPRFKIDCTMNLKDPLTELGLGVIFDKELANCSGITEEKLHVSKIIQKAVIEVNEDGAEAAVATSGSMYMMLSCPPIFKADHPFVFVLLASRNPIFVGQVTNPSEENQ